jgi:dodecin
MALTKVIEVLSESDKNWENAVQNAVTEASKTLHNIQWVDVEHLKTKVENGKIVSWKLKCKISFELDGKNK